MSSFASAESQLMLRLACSETPPAPEDPVLGTRTHAADRNARAATSDMPLPPTAGTWATNMGDQRVSLIQQLLTQACVPAPMFFTQLISAQVPAAGARSIPQPIFPPTPAHRAVNRLVNQLTQQAAMASPGPYLRDLIHGNSDVEDSDSEDFPIVQHQQPLLAPALSSAADSDDKNPPPRRAAARKKVPGRCCGRGGTAAPPPAETTNDIEAGSAYVFINPADSDYFFGHCEIDKGFKC
ncbi:hypothetical protein DFH08DRAFT_802561 [Mycena albidolilacea]|uniref:Uncharacterized protein n=1 Tax=Mycena albidolilacea TaxID=1033008 RepID=A0AAD7EZJ9_9AGAR|nr:hypothetical protein DFH08DRAFT_802561 [Mycena albidolilacea]